MNWKSDTFCIRISILLIYIRYEKIWSIIWNILKWQYFFRERESSDNIKYVLW